MTYAEKIKWSGIIVSVQPRSSVWRYRLDNRTHSLRGYNIFLEGIIDRDADEKTERKVSEKADGTGEKATFSIAISETQQNKLQFQIGDKVSGTAWTKMYDFSEYADYYRAGALEIMQKGPAVTSSPPPYIMLPPDLATYEWRGARMLSTMCYKKKCFQCIWASMADVTIEYNWGVSQKHRYESFCYGPKSCKYYKMGKPRAVPDKQYGSFYDEGWLDDICTENRGEDE